MLILGLGTNLGDNLNNLRQALLLLGQSSQFKVLEVSPIYQSDALLPVNAPPTWSKSYLNLAAACETTLAPEEVLSFIKGIEAHLGRKQNERWAPRLIDIDILAWGNQSMHKANLQIPHPGLLERPFALWPLLDLLPDWQHPQHNINEMTRSWGSRFSQQAPFRTHQIPHRIDISSIVGILNITADSFSDGGHFTSVATALTHAKKLFNDGAEIIDIGAESTRPGATAISPQQEWALLEPIIHAIKQHWQQQSFKPKISIDTRHYEVAEKSLELNVDWINDVTGFSDPDMQAVVAKTNAKCVVMHNLGVPPQKDIVLSTQQNACPQVIQWAQQRLQELTKAGIQTEQLIFDIGIGFGKTPQQNFELLKNISQFQQLKIPLLVGHSRKSFLGLLNDKKPQERDLETAILSYHLAQQKVNYLRVHDVAGNVEAVKIAGKMKQLNTSY